MEVRIKRLSPEAVMPSKAHPSDAGFDLYAIEDKCIEPRGRMLLDTGIALDIPIGYCGLVTGRSGNTIKRGLVGQLGIIDSGYYGSIGIMAFNETDDTILVKKGDRVGQIIIVPHLPLDFKESDDFTVVNRGGGFGSTGK